MISDVSSLPQPTQVESLFLTTFRVLRPPKFLFLLTTLISVKNSLTGLKIGFPNYTMSLLYTIKEFGPKDMWSSMAQTYKIINEITWGLYEPPDLQNVSKCPTTGYFWIRFSILEHNARWTCQHSPTPGLTPTGQWFCINPSPFYLVNFKF